jgi:DNA-binding NarL/FixJ family response regulator
MGRPTILLFSNSSNTLRKWSCALANEYQLEVAVDWQECKANYEKLHPAIDITIIDGKLFALENNFSTLAKDAPGKLIIVGEQWPEDRQVQLIAAGASGYEENETDLEFLSRTVSRVIDGEVWIQRHLVPRIIKTLVANKIDPLTLHDNEELTAKKKDLLKSLTEREKQVANQVSHGSPTKKIAAALFITERTVTAHLSSIFRKLDVPDRIHLAIYLKDIR